MLVSMVERFLFCLLAVVGVVAFAACSSDSLSSPGASVADAAVSFSSAALSGRDLYNDNGCVACHRSDGSGGSLGPRLAGRLGDVAVFSDGSSAVVNRGYLVESILSPQARIVDGYSVQMPANGLSAAQADLVAQFISELPNL